MENNSSQLSGFNTRFTGDYLDGLLHGPNNSALMGEELEKINAHLVQEEALMKKIFTSVGITFALAAIVYLCWMPAILSGGAALFSK